MSEARPRRIPTRLLWLLSIVGMIILIAAAILLSRRATFAAPLQPINFNHQIHGEAGVQCLYCHPNAMRSDIAGVPSVEKCAGCHRTIARDRSEVRIVLGYWERQEPIPWAPVVDMADHVYFSHQPHLSASLSCETCHGDVGQMSTARPAVDMDMGWCLRCHLDEPEAKVARLADCLACHE
jgi:hypothetical protein